MTTWCCLLSQDRTWARLSEKQGAVRAKALKSRADLARARDVEARTLFNEVSAARQPRMKRS